MIRMTIVKKGDILLDIKNKIRNVKEAVQRLGADGARQMADIINSNVKRHPNEGVTEQAILNASHTIDDYSYGIGEISVLQQTAPWWYVIDTGQMWTGGAYIPPYTRGFFGQGNPPIEGENRERLTFANQGYYVYPKKPIRPMNYINLTKLWIEANINIYLKQAESK